MSVLKSVFEQFSKVLFCSRCRICGEVVEIDHDLCGECQTLEKIEIPYCIHCGCSKTDCICKNKKNEYKQIAAVYYYKDSIIRAVSNFKNNDMPFLAENMADEIYSLVQEVYRDIDFDYITYVPLRKFRLLKRGFNQPQLIADTLSKRLDVEAIGLLSKVRYTGVQHHKSARERSADVFGAYDVIDEYKYKLDGKTILLIDDVKTTGSTLNECAKMLKIYGAKNVYAAAFAATKKETEL